MKRNKTLRLALPRLINYLLFCGGAFLLGSGLALETRLPPGSRGGHGLSMLGMTRHEWGELHFYVGLAMAALVLLHLALHWGWLKNALKSATAKLGYVGLAIGLIIFLIPLILPITQK
ncbi:hypothetical protein VDG1235_4175 [Verrucomicrobiia bacterium DG1235]|nr:hypothetical protein VDG1235_4175 [Verrucomicrobiae bacterium DG1235]